MTDPDANAGLTAHQGCTVGGVPTPTYTQCTTLDGTFAVLPVSSANALNQTTQTGYTQTAAGGFGLWPTALTDVNGQATTIRYDALGRTTSETLPGEGAGLTTRSWTYLNTCAPTGAQSPCVEVDGTQRLNATTSVTSRAFYDGWGRLVETRTPAPANRDLVQYRFYDASGRVAFTSVPYFVTVGAGYSIPDSTQPGTTVTYDGLGRVTSTTDPLSNQITNQYTVACNVPGTGDPACYEQTMRTDALSHRGSGLGDAFGRLAYNQRFSGNSPLSYAVYATTKFTYDLGGRLTQIVHPDGVTMTTFQYDMAGRRIGMVDPDLGTMTFGYDQNGNLTQSVDPRGAAGTIFVGYDGLDRPIWRNTTNTPTGAYQSYTYDGTLGGNQGVGRLTGQAFNGTPNNALAGSYTYVYDGRGQETARTLTVGTASYQVSTLYDDAGNITQTTYPSGAGEQVTISYTPEGWLSDLSSIQGTTTTPLFNAATYDGPGGAAQKVTGGTLGSAVYTYAATYDLLARPTDIKLTRTSDAAIRFEQAPTYDAAGNVIKATTTIPKGIDNQAFCYDEQDRPTWAGSQGTPPCSGIPIPAGTLPPAAQYAQAFSHDNMGRLTGGTLGGYTYGDPAHVHAATAAGPTYPASYNAAGQMICRAATGGPTTCAGPAPNGNQLTDDNEARLVAWQDVPGATPGTTTAYLYDGSGQRVVQQVTQGGGTTTTVYVGDLMEVNTDPTGVSTTTTYYYAGGRRVALAVNGVFSYLATDALGSVSVAVDAGGLSNASQLYQPYWGIRFSSGTIPTDRGYIGERNDAATGLSYFNARYYDPLAGQFVTPDPILPGGGFNPWGLSRYAYAEGNPVTSADPSGLRMLECDPCGSPIPVTPTPDREPRGIPSQREIQPPSPQVTPGPPPPPAPAGRRAEGRVDSGSIQNIGSTPNLTGFNAPPPDILPPRTGPRTEVPPTGSTIFTTPDQRTGLRGPVTPVPEQVPTIRFTTTAGPPGINILINVVIQLGNRFGILHAEGSTEGATGTAGKPPAEGAREGGGSGVIFVDPRGNALPAPPGGSITGSPDGTFIQVRDGTVIPRAFALMAVILDTESRAAKAHMDTFQELPIRMGHRGCRSTND